MILFTWVSPSKFDLFLLVKIPIIIIQHILKILPIRRRRQPLLLTPTITLGYTRAYPIGPLIAHKLLHSPRTHKQFLNLGQRLGRKHPCLPLHPRLLVLRHRQKRHPQRIHHLRQVLIQPRDPIHPLLKRPGIVLGLFEDDGLGVGEFGVVFYLEALAAGAGAGASSDGIGVGGGWFVLGVGGGWGEEKGEGVDAGA